MNFENIYKQHAVLTRYDDGSWTIGDVGGRGGIAINGEPITGLTEIGYGGAKMKIFDRERLMCECLKYEDKMERELFKEGLLAYIRDPKKDVAKLMKYARERRVVKKVQTMIGVWL